MSGFFLAGIGFTVLYLLPVVALHVICELIRYLNMRGKAGTRAEKLARINFEVYRYLVYMLAVPALMLITSVVMGYVHGFDSVKNSMIWLIIAIAIAFTWVIGRLIRAVSKKSRLEAEAGQAG